MSGSGERYEAPSTMSSGLLSGLQSDNPDAWRRLVTLYGPLVYHWCRRSGLQTDDAADVGQEVFQAVAAHIADFRRDREGDTFCGWLWTITKNKIRDHYRKHGTEPHAIGGTNAYRNLQDTPDEVPPDDPESNISQQTGSLFRRGLERIRAEFEERTWQAFWRSAVGGDQTSDIAQDLDMSAVAVRKAKSRVLRRLREELGEEFG